MKTTEKKKSGKKKSPAPKKLSKKTIVLCSICAALLIAGVAAFLIIRGSTQAADAPASTGIDESMLHGEDASGDLLIGDWVTYSEGKKTVYSIDGDGCWVIRYTDTDPVEYHYEVQGDRIVRTLGEKKRIYIWSERAVSFIADHQHGEASHLTSLIAEEIKSFSGYMYVQGDYMYFGSIVLCREDKMTGFDDPSLVGTWTGSASDRVTFSADGAYHYRQEGNDYDGTYELDDAADQLTLKLAGTEDVVLSSAEWSINGRVLRLGSMCYFRDVEE